MIVIMGVSGVGKSTVGRLVTERLGLPFVATGRARAGEGRAGRRCNFAGRHGGQGGRRRPVPARL